MKKQNKQTKRGTSEQSSLVSASGSEEPWNPIPTSCAVAVEKWDKGESVFTIEMGGLGPGYEQAIQVLMIELVRESLKTHTKKPKAFEKMRDSVVHRINEQCGGYSGAQVGAATSLAYSFVTKGWRETIELYKAKDPGRTIQVSRAWPQPPAPPNGGFTYEGKKN